MASFAPGKLPPFRLSSTGGTSVALADFKGRPVLFYGWASWHPSREALDAVERFHAEHGKRVAVASIAFDAEGPGHPMRYFTTAKCTHLPLIDASFVLDRIWGVKELPFWVLADDGGCVQASGGGFDPAAALAALDRGPVHHRHDKTPVEHRFEEFEFLVQDAGIVLSRRKVDQAVERLTKAHRLKPDNRLVVPQMLAVRNPEKFYSGPIDTAWVESEIKKAG